MKIHETINTAFQRPAFQSLLTAMGHAPLVGTPQRFATMPDEDIRRWTEVVKDSGAKGD